ALAGRRFRWVLLGLAGVPIGLAYLWYGFLKPLVSDEATDFVREYLAGGRVILHGGDPYQCGLTAALCDGYPHYLLFYPPFAYWVAQPLVRFNPRLVAGIALVAANVLLFAAIWLVLRALRVRDAQFALLAVLVTISFPPTLTVIQNRNSQVVVLVLIAIMLTAWLHGDRWWGGAALGVGLAIKLIQAPLLLLSLWGRRFGLAAPGPRGPRVGGRDGRRGDASSVHADLRGPACASATADACSPPFRHSNALPAGRGGRRGELGADGALLPRIDERHGGRPWLSPALADLGRLGARGCHRAVGRVAPRGGRKKWRNA